MAILQSIIFLFEDKNNWGDVLADILRNPQRYVVWLIGIFIILFILSRLNNNLEEQGTARAMAITRGLVGSLMFFVIGPVVFFLLFIAFALVNNLPTPNISFLIDWLKLTATTYWWIIRCSFNDARIAETQVMYNNHAIVRLLWVLLPLIFVWLRNASGRISKLLLVPVIAGILFVTQYKEAPVTFITQGEAYEQVKEYLPSFLVDAPNSAQLAKELTPDQEQSRNLRTRIFAIILSLVVAAGFLVGFYFQRRVIAILIVALGIGGFFVLSPGAARQTIKEGDSLENVNTEQVNIPDLVERFEKSYEETGSSVETYEISLLIQRAIDEQNYVLDKQHVLCQKYKKYFYDYCP